MVRQNPLKAYTMNNTQASSPPRDINGSREVSDETIFVHTSLREAMPPALSTCDISTTSDVTSANPSRTDNVTSGVINTNPCHTTTGDVSSTNPSCTVDVTSGIVNTNADHGVAGDIASVNLSCTVHATGDVVNANPSHGMTGDVASANPSRTLNATGDAVNANLGHTDIGDTVVNANPPVAPPPKPRSKLIRVTCLYPNHLINWNNLQSVVNQNLGARRTCYCIGPMLGRQLDAHTLPHWN